MARRWTATAAAALTVLTGAPAFAQPPASATVSTVVNTLEAVCRPSTEANVPPDVSATRLHYPSVEVPPNLPTGRPLHAWKAPSPGPGVIYLLDGGLPESAQAGCVVAVYGEALPTLPGVIQAHLAQERAGFQPNPTLSVSSPRQSVVRFDRRKGDVVTSILIIQPTLVAVDAPSALVIVSRVDYSWLSKFGG